MDSRRPTFDAVVVGSGYGGAIAACRLAQAGFSVCMLEKGKRWEFSDFPTSPWSLLPKMTFFTAFGIFGGKQGLFQVHIQKESIALTASGLGGGSLLNAGVILPTPKRVLKDPRWPKEWNQDWDLYESKRDAVLQPESQYHIFPKALIMDKVRDEIEDSTSDPIKLTMTFSKKTNAAGIVQEACIACGNCLSGCPYNAKTSNDKTYIALAAQAGAQIYTEKEVAFILPTTYYDLPEMWGCPCCPSKETSVVPKQRRWRVYLNEVDYIYADYVVLSAGVLGTTQILFRSQERGLSLSEKLGCGLSCNGNNIALVTGTRVQTQGYGLRPKDLPAITLPLRPGPVICNSLTSSLGFSIQGSVIPQAAPIIVLKGLVTYKLPMGWDILYGLWDHLKKCIGNPESQALALNIMGHDSSDGQIKMNQRTKQMAYSAPEDALYPRKVQAVQRIARRLGGQLFLSRFRSISVHLLGGCNASSNSSLGVTNPNGQVYSSTKGDDKSYPHNNISSIHEGLYICDGSVIPCSVGVNPVGTIATLSERISSCIVQDARKFFDCSSASAFSSPLLDSTCPVVVQETLHGHLGGLPCTIRLTMHMGSSKHPNETLLQGSVGGFVNIAGLHTGMIYILDGTVNMCYVDSRSPFTQWMHYHLLLRTTSGKRYLLMAKKELRPYLCGIWSFHESTTLASELLELPIQPGSNKLRGTLHVTPLNLLCSLLSMRGTKKVTFLWQLLGSIIQTYFLPSPKTDISIPRPETILKKYPEHIMHEIKTEDGMTITCKQWPVVNSPRTPNKVVLLLNGYIIESFSLPTEEHDFVRTLLQNGYEPWLLQTRLHPSHPSCKFDFDHIAKYDIPSAFHKIRSTLGAETSINVIAHCVGGLCIHMSLMGGHISASWLASLICTNSSMFFSLTREAMLKMRLPLLPMSMLILGEQTILPIIANKTISSRHKILRAVATTMPRAEYCSVKECNIFSGIFGSGFWHTNISQKMHDWIAKQGVPILPMAAFPHLRKISLAGHICDARGNNAYLIHPERLKVSTTYVYGGKPILVTPETCHRGHKFMKQHHPEYSHACFEIPDYGHSDLWIGEKSHLDVFPRILERLQSRSNAETNIRRNTPLPLVEAQKTHWKILVAVLIVGLIIHFIYQYMG